MMMVEFLFLYFVLSGAIKYTAITNLNMKLYDKKVFEKGSVPT